MASRAGCATAAAKRTTSMPGLRTWARTAQHPAWMPKMRMRGLRGRPAIRRSRRRRCLTPRGASADSTQDCAVYAEWIASSMDSRPATRVAFDEMRLRALNVMRLGSKDAVRHAEAQIGCGPTLHASTVSSAHSVSGATGDSVRTISSTPPYSGQGWMNPARYSTMKIATIVHRPGR